MRFRDTYICHFVNHWQIRFYPTLLIYLDPNDGRWYGGHIKEGL